MNSNKKLPEKKKVKYPGLITYDGKCPKCDHNKFYILNPSHPEIHECEECEHFWNPLHEKKP
jgi:hypothetical protein